MQKRNRINLIIVAAFFLGFFAACEEEGFIKSPSAKLRFSADTVMFDTVFTTIGSTTKRFTVKNPHNKKININSIKLAGGKQSDYRLNINGTQTSGMSDVELKAKDSLYIFVEVTIDPNNSNNPMVVKDSIIFSTNGNTQDIKLVSWGQDVHLINGEIVKTQTWNADKPYLVYNSALVDTQNTLTIKPGTKIHFHRNSRFFIAGRLISNGTKEEPVVFTSDRLEEDYSDIPGQWDGIWLMPSSNDNIINYTHIKNAVIGLQVDTLDNTPAPTLTISNSKVQNMTYAGIYAQGTTIKGYNNVISNCGEYALALTIGGSYEFYHCTIANYWSGSTRNTPSVLFNNYYVDINDNIQNRGLERALFNNCIIVGNNTSEIGFDFKPGSSMNYKLENCLVKAGSKVEIPEKNHENLLRNKDPKFISIIDQDYRLDTLSPAIDQGDPRTGEKYPLDILQNSRNNDEAPDLGAYEFIPGTGKEEDN